MNPADPISAEAEERPAKRQRTNSPPDSSSQRPKSREAMQKMSHPLEADQSSEQQSNSIPGLGLIDTPPTEVEVLPTIADGGDNLLDTLMRHVDAQSHMGGVNMKNEAPLHTADDSESQNITEQLGSTVKEQVMSPAAASETTGLDKEMGLANGKIAETTEDTKQKMPSKEEGPEQLPAATAGSSPSHDETNETANDTKSRENLQDAILAADEQNPNLPAANFSGLPVLSNAHQPESMDLKVAEPDISYGKPQTDGCLEEESSPTGIPKPDVTSLRDQLPLVDETQASSGTPKDEGAEWEVDSSPVDSSSDSTSSSESSSSEDSNDDAENDGDYTMLDPEEQARILMQGEGGSDDEGHHKPGQQLRTTNEKPEEVIPMPIIEVTDDMRIEELGSVEGVVENTVLIKAKTTGEYQVLEVNSLLCLQDRSVVGVVSETLGRVQQPLYTVRFTNEDAIKAAGLWETKTKVFYVADHSTFVFTQPLRGVKGSDASNLHDEEVGAGEIEFSDDEAEAEHKRMMKNKKKYGRETSDIGQGSHRGKRGGGRNSLSRNGNVHANSTPEMNYDDVPTGDEDGYTPLARPMNLHEMMGTGEAPVEGRPMPPPFSPPFSEGGFERGRGRGYGRGQSRGQGRGAPGPGRGRGGRGRGGWDRRGDSQTHPSMNHQHSQPTVSPPTPQQSASQPSPFPLPSMPPIPQYPYPSQQYPQLNTNSIPQAPTITPQPNGTGYVPFSPSPISPLPGTNFNFNSFAAQYNQNQHPHQNQQQSPNMAGYPPNFSGQGGFAGWNGNGNGNGMANGNGYANSQMGPPAGSHVNPNFFSGTNHGMGSGPGGNARGGWHG